MDSLCLPARSSARVWQVMDLRLGCLLHRPAWDGREYTLHKQDNDYYVQDDRKTVDKM